MKKNIRGQIIQTSKRLFNERSYSAVSTQDIADAIGISKGNLNYHFRRKEDIMEAVVADSHSRYTPPDPPATLEELNTLFLRVHEIIRENAFYFWCHTQLPQVPEKVRQRQSRVLERCRALLTDSFRLLRLAGSLRPEEYPGQDSQTIRALMMACIYWTPFARLERRESVRQDYLTCIWGILYPLLTDRGRAQLAALRAAQEEIGD